MWLDGAYLGDTEGYFFPHTFEVTEALRARGEHHLAVEVTCAPQPDRTAKRNITGVFQHWDCLDPDWNPGGIWRPVRVTETGPVRITRPAGAVPRGRPSPGRRRRCGPCSTATEPARSHRPHHGRRPSTTRPTSRWPAGDNQVEWTVTVDRPALWWPRALGDPPCTTSTSRCDVLDAAEGAGVRPAHAAHRPAPGRMRSWICSVNGERLFLKGANQGPTRMALAEATPAELARDVDLACEAGLDLLRIHAHITRPELYDAADEAGLLLWQDFPLQWGYARGIRKQAVRQAREAVDLLGHHPSIAIWCGHNEPMAIENDPSMWGDRKALRRMAMKAAVAQELPTWNKTVLDRSVKRAFEKADGTRPVIAHSGVLPHPPQLDGTDSHLYFGWYHGDERDLPGFLPRPSPAWCASSPSSAPRPSRSPPTSWSRSAGPTSTGSGSATPTPSRRRSSTSSCPPVRTPPSTSGARPRRSIRPSWCADTSRPCGASSTGRPAASPSSASPTATPPSPGRSSATTAPKLGYEALREACRPVIVVADRLPATVAPGEALALDVHVVSDLRGQVDDAKITARLFWDGGGSRTWRWRGDIPADGCQRVGTVQIVVPDAPGPLALVLACRHGGQQSDNRYESLIAT